MNLTQRILAALSLLTLWLALAPIAAMADVIDRTYWDKAVAVAAKNECLAPRNIVETEEVSAADGKPLERNLTHLQVIQKSGATLDITLVSREENGVDTTEKFYKHFLAHKEETLSELKEEGLFAKSSQRLVKLTGFDLKDKVATYTFAIDVDGIAFSGLARICAIKGDALSATVTTPKMEEDGVLISNYEEITHYQREDGRWYPAKVIETMDIKMGGFFNSFEGKVEAETILTDYFCNQ